MHKLLLFCIALTVFSSCHNPNRSQGTSPLRDENNEISDDPIFPQGYWYGPGFYWGIWIGSESEYWNQWEQRNYNYKREHHRGDADNRTHDDDRRDPSRDPRMEERSMRGESHGGGRR